MAEVTRFEIHVTATDEHGNTSSFLQWAKSGHRDDAGLEADKEFDRIVAAMRGEDVGIFADHFRRVELRRGEHGADLLRRAEYGDDGQIVEPIS